MGAEVKIWNPVEVAEQASHDYDSQIHSSQLTIDPSLELPKMTPLVLNMCKDMFKAWADLNDSCFAVEKISGGITNLSAGFGAKWLGIFGNGMVQSFINAQTLSPSDMREPKLAAKIAKQLQRFHDVEIPGSKEPQLWNDVWKFFEKASVLEFDDSEMQKTYETISFKELHDEIVELKGLCDLLKSPVIFAHNDLLSGNIMINYEEDKLYFIDYEYASYNYRGYDLGNHFAEYAGFDCDFDLYPNINEQYHFFRHYLQPERPHEVSEKDLEALYVEANTFSLASHVFWALWGLIQAKMSPIEFDYLGYFFLRYNEYKRQKEKNFLLARTYLTGCKNE
ncbi:probable ethanolamine kinase isoform X2 [Vigna unguiculata]|uniref:probable ethanolamine kinase isoform X2 n=1 Tax=Vigna unguiculata TaxID=3917 RepID=UPI001016D2EC|nr:probable ethanolamine kinase isoform X2 [Vigna unguiculata]